MKQHILALCMLTLCVSLGYAQNNFRQQDRWLALIDFAQLKAEAIQNAAPHFPKTEVKDEKSYQQFTEKLAQWKKKHSAEVEAFLSLPEIKKLNPSRVHLGLQQAVEPRKFENSYWQWITAAGLSASDIKAVAPNFPQPRITADLTQSERIYEAALQDWMKLFPKENEAVLNHPVLITLKKSHEPVFIDASTAEAFTLMEITEQQPLRSDYDSGNKALDDVRYEMALKHWYFKFRTEEYLVKYNVQEYHKNVEGK